MKKLKYALIGCGRISPNHIAAGLALSDELELAAICDLCPERMQELAASFALSETARFTDYREMLAVVRPDFVAVATESGSHAAIGLDCIRAGASLLLEKPMALSLEDADLLIEEAEKKGVRLGVCHQNRCNRSIQKIRSALEEGRFGRLYHGTAHIRWNRGEHYYRQAAWRGSWKDDGGALMNQCIHAIDLLRWMMGDGVAEVVAYTDRLSHRYIEAEDLGLALIRFSNGGYGVVEGTTNVFPENLEETLCLFGERGTVKVSGKSMNRIEEWRFLDGEDAAAVKREFSEEPPNVYGFGHTPLYRDMAAAIRENRPPLCDGPAGRRALELVLAIYRSAAEKRPVLVPMNKCKTIDFTGLFGEAERNW